MTGASVEGRGRVSGMEGGARGELERRKALSREFQDVGNLVERRIEKGWASTGRIVSHPGSKVSVYHFFLAPHVWTG